jgi:hypothetical protein
VDVVPYDLLRAIGNLSVWSDNDGVAHTERMVKLLVNGSRYGAQNMGCLFADCIRNGFWQFSPKSILRASCQRLI